MCYTWEHSNHELKSLWNFGPFSWHPKGFMPVPRGMGWDMCCRMPKVRWPVLQKTTSPGQKYPERRTKLSSAPSWLFSGESQTKVLQSKMSRCLVTLYGKAWLVVTGTDREPWKQLVWMCIKPEMEKDIPVFFCGTLFHSLKVKSLSEFVLLLFYFKYM